MKIKQKILTTFAIYLLNILLVLLVSFLIDFNKINMQIFYVALGFTIGQITLTFLSFLFALIRRSTSDDILGIPITINSVACYIIQIIIFIIFNVLNSLISFDANILLLIEIFFIVLEIIVFCLLYNFKLRNRFFYSENNIASFGRNIRRNLKLIDDLTFKKYSSKINEIIELTYHINPYLFMNNNELSSNLLSFLEISLNQVKVNSNQDLTDSLNKIRMNLIMLVEG